MEPPPSDTDGPDRPLTVGPLSLIFGLNYIRIFIIMYPIPRDNAIKGMQVLTKRIEDTNSLLVG